MPSSFRPIIISSECDIEDAMSSTRDVAQPVIQILHPLPLASKEDTESFYEDEVTPTPQISPLAPSPVLHAPTDSSSRDATVYPKMDSHIPL